MLLVFVLVFDFLLKLMQLHIDGKFVGGYDEMLDLEEIGEFEKLVLPEGETAE